MKILRSESIDYAKLARATKIQEYNPYYVVDPDEKVYSSIDRTAEAVEKRYQCSTCEYADGCQEGEFCYKDYIFNRERDKRRTSEIAKPPHEYDYYFRRT